MEVKTRRKIGLLIAAVALFTALFTLGRALYFPSTDGITKANEGYTLVSDVSVPDSSYSYDEEPPSTRPSRLLIPKIGIDTHVQHLGINASGNMAVPSNFTDVGWYKYGPVPGSAGSSVIAGHQDNALGTDAIFKKLENLSIGDNIYIVRADGQKLQFRVIDMKIHPYDLRGPELEKIFNDKSGTYLNLITCAGTWLPAARTNDKRLVVYTELVKS